MTSLASAPYLTARAPRFIDTHRAPAPSAPSHIAVLQDPLVDLVAAVIALPLHSLYQWMLRRGIACLQDGPYTSSRP